MPLDRLTSNRFLVLGRAGMDLYADPPGTRAEEATKFVAALGGSSANIAAGIVRLGGQASLISAVSTDAVGRFTINELKKYGVGTSYVRSVGGEARNSLAVVETRVENCQSVIYRNGAADFEIDAEQVEKVDYDAFGGLIVTGTSLAAQPSRASTLLAIGGARSAGLTVILDVDFRPYSWPSDTVASEICGRAAALCDIVIGNDDEFAMLASAGGDGLAFARQLAVTSAAIVVYKRGEKGSVTLTKKRTFETGIFRVATLKPTGAGDAFMGGFVTGLAVGRDLETCVGRGSAAAAIVVMRVGCAPAMPTPAELDQFMASHPGPV